MKSVVLLLLSFPLMTGCAFHHADSAQSRFSDTAERQQSESNHQADEYLDCVGSIDHKTAVENYTDKNTRREVVLESCREEITRFTILQEQAYDNTCRSSGKDATACDNEAVSKARHDTDVLLQKASERVDHTTAARRNYRQ
ncbi:MAG TPA: hypothetical protein VLB90_00565 [Pseudomonadales bacterium]|nr:hypothetical protein [Pseudomonadales bacterium]